MLITLLLYHLRTPRTHSKKINIPSNTLQPKYLELINSILAICSVLLDLLGSCIKEENNKYFYTQDLLRNALSIAKVIDHRVKYITKEK